MSTSNQMNVGGYAVNLPTPRSMPGSNPSGSAWNYTPSTPSWQSNLGAAIPGALQNLGQAFGGRNTTTTGIPQFSQGTYNQFMGNLPELSQLAEMGQQNMGLYNQAIAGIQGGMGKTDISELRKNWGQLSDLGGAVYDPFRQGIQTLQDYRQQLGTGTTAADVAMGRQLREASAQQMLANPFMTAAQRGASEFENRARAAEGAYGERLGQFGQVTGQLSQAQQALGQAQLQGISAAGNLAAQMSGFRAGDMARIIAGNATLAQLAMTNPQQAAIQAILSTKMGMMNMATGTQQTGQQGSSGFNKALGVASVAAPIIIAI